MEFKQNNLDMFTVLVTTPKYFCYRHHLSRDSWGRFYQHGLFLIPVWISNHMPSKVWDEITYRFPNFYGATVEAREWISNVFARFIMDVITYLCGD